MNKNGLFAPRCQMLSNSYCTAMGVKCFERRLIGGVKEGMCVGRSEEVRAEPMPVMPQQIKGFTIERVRCCGKRSTCSTECESLVSQTPNPFNVELKPSDYD